MRSKHRARVARCLQVRPALMRPINREKAMRIRLKKTTPTLLNVDSNAKTVKGQSKGYMTAILYLAPYKASGFNVCPMADVAGCVAACLNTAGRGGMSKGNAEFTADDGLTMLPDNSVQRARIARTRFLIADRFAFMAQLAEEIARFIRKASRKGLTPVVRLNGTSDIRWEDLPCGDHANVFAAFPDVTFYDYTKIPNRRRIPANYHLTFSGSGRAEWQPYVDKALSARPDMNLTIVFRGALPATYAGRPVINGDESDLRFLDPAGVVVGLTAKGRAKKDFSGFVVG